jgi:hypothetical protein
MVGTRMSNDPRGNYSYPARAPITRLSGRYVGERWGPVADQELGGVITVRQTSSLDGAGRPVNASFPHGPVVRCRW